MIDDPYYVGASVLFVFFLAVFIGILVSVFLGNRADSAEQNPRHQRMIQAVFTFALTALLSFLVFWINLRTPRKTYWSDIKTSSTESSAIHPTSTPDS